MIRRMLRLMPAAMLLWSITTPTQVHAYSVSLADGSQGPLVRWMTNSLSYYLHPSCSADLNAASCLNAVRASFDEWEDPTCSALNFTEVGFSNNLQLTAVGYSGNDKNEVAWIENSQWTCLLYTSPSPRDRG